MPTCGNMVLIAIRDLERGYSPRVSDEVLPLVQSYFQLMKPSRQYVSVLMQGNLFELSLRDNGILTSESFLKFISPFPEWSEGLNNTVGAFKTIGSDASSLVINKPRVYPNFCRVFLKKEEDSPLCIEIAFQDSHWKWDLPDITLQEFENLLLRPVLYECNFSPADLDEYASVVWRYLDDVCRKVGK